MDKTPVQWMIEPLRKYATFEGRARRKEYWWFYLFSFILVLIGGVIDNVIFGPDALADSSGLGPVSGLAILALLLPTLAAGVRRLHDGDRSGWWLLVAFLPLVGALLLLFWYCSRGTIGPNRFGADPIGSDS